MEKNQQSSVVLTNKSLRTFATNRQATSVSRDFKTQLLHHDSWQHGGGTFLVPYTIMLFLAGMPVFLLEVIKECDKVS